MCVCVCVCVGVCIHLVCFIEDQATPQIPVRLNKVLCNCMVCRCGMNCSLSIVCRCGIHISVHGLHVLGDLTALSTGVG